MKRVICLLLALMMLMMTLGVSAEKYSSEPEKLMLQFRKGSGLKGTFSLNAAGTAEWASKLSSMNGTLLQLRFLDEKANGFQYRIYAETDEGMVATTEAVGDGTTAYITSDFLMGKTYTMPAKDGLISAFLDLMAGKPNWYTLVTNLLMIRPADWTNEWEPQLALFESALETWLAPYLMPETVTGEGETLIISHYTIPTADVKAQLSVMLDALMNNPTLMELLTQQADQGQISLYLQPQYLLWYQQIVESMPMEGDVVLERTQSVKGEVKDFSLSFPVGSNAYGLTEVLIENSDHKDEYTAIFEDKTLFLSAEKHDDVIAGVFRLIRREGESISVSYTLTSTVKTYVDSSNRNHEEGEYVLSAEPDLSHLDLLSPERETYADFGTLNATLTTSFYSKSSDTTPVTASISLDLTLDDNSVQSVLTLKSASPWRLPEAPEGPYTDLAAMTAEERSALLADWFNNGLAAMKLLQPEADENAPEEMLSPAETEEEAAGGEAEEAEGDAAEEEQEAADAAPEDAADAAEHADEEDAPDAVEEE